MEEKLKKYEWIRNEFVYVNSTNGFRVNYPNQEVAIRLNPVYDGKVFYTPIDGKLYQCKIVSASLEMRRKDIRGGHFVCQQITLDIAGLGRKTMDYAIIGEYENFVTSFDGVKQKMYLYSSVENFKEKRYTNPFINESSKRFFEGILGTLEWHYTPSDGISCGSIGSAKKYYWNGTKVETIVAGMPTKGVLYHPNGSVEIVNYDVEDYIRLMNEVCYPSYNECRENGINHINVVSFDDNAPASTTDNNADITDKIAKWANEQKISVDKLAEVLNKMVLAR